MNKKYIKSFFFRLTRVTLIVYLIFWGFLYFFQWSLLYHPSQVSFYDCPQLEDYEMRVYASTRFYKLSQWSNGVLIHYHGNAWRACDRAFKRSILESSWRDIILVEYSWFGWNAWFPNKKKLEKNVQDLIDYSESMWYLDIMIYGESLGTWLASYHASLWKVEKLILVSPFSSIWDIATTRYSVYPISLLLRENYDSIEALKNYSGEITILHWENDTIISPTLSRNLYDSLSSTQQKEYYLIPGNGHNDLWNSDIFLDIFKKELR